MFKAFNITPSPQPRSAKLDHLTDSKQAINDLGLQVPVVVRLEGTNAEIAKEILRRSGVEIIPSNDLKDAAQKAVEVVLKGVK